MADTHAWQDGFEVAAAARGFEWRLRAGLCNPRSFVGVAFFETPSTLVRMPPTRMPDRARLDDIHDESGVTFVTDWANTGMLQDDGSETAAPEVRSGRAPLPAAADGRTELRSSDAAADRAMDRYASGESAAFSELYDLLAPRLFAFLLRSTRSRCEAEDLVQQTMLKMHCARGRFIRGAGVVPWAFSIARRLMIDRARRSKVRGAVSDPGDPADVLAQLAALDLAVDEVVHSKLIGKVIQQELDRLSPRNRVAFELVKQDGLTHAEAAKVLGTTVMAVKLRTHRTCAVLRAALQKSLKGGEA
jgi:RNA polymerase sigma-70 factor (ECF subfamily)